MKQDVFQLLESLSTFGNIPREELAWLAQNGKITSFPAGLIYKKGYKIEDLYIILEGSISVRVDRGAGPKKVNTELNTGSVSGLLPYSRLVQLPGDLYADMPSKALMVNGKLFPEMINKCPEFTAHTVHSMIDRTRIHTTSAMLDEKMVAMGKLAAGLAHELNNPASVAIRDAKLLREGQDAVDHATHLLSKAGLADDEFEQIGHMRQTCLEISRNVILSPIEKADLHDKLNDWLEQHNLDNDMAAQLADLAVQPENLEKFLDMLPDPLAEAALQWVVARCNLDKLAAEIEQSTNQICTLVDAVRKFTHMDSVSSKELVNVESGISDALKLLEVKSKAKKASITMEIAKDLPSVYANGAELNQVWFSLLDNALDAIPDAGQIHVSATLESDFITIRFCDNGPGISTEMIERIFDPFFTTKPPGKGTGLGLDLSRRVIRSNNGDIYVHSQPGQTEFYVNLSLNHH